jgi:hypothetical protein
MDEINYIKNPYFFIREYEDKGVYVLLKKDKGITLTYDQLQNICFECPDLEVHQGISKMVLFHVDKENKIYKYTIASSKYKILRSDCLLYETFIGQKVE